MKIAVVRGKFLNRYEMQFYEPLRKRFDLTAFSSLSPFHDKLTFPVIKLPSPMDLPEFPYKMSILNRLCVDAHYLFGLEEHLMGYDLVHTAETYYHYTQQSLNAKKKGYVKKVIATVLENIPFNNEGIVGRKQFKKRARQELDLLIALTNKTKEALLKEGADPQKITVLPHFIDTSRFKPTHIRHSSRLVVLFVGRLELYKGVNEVIKATETLRKKYDFEVQMIGSGSLKSKIPKWITVRTVPYETMPQVYNNADLLIAPSLPTPTWEEQYNTVLLEAQASGLPIVTTKTGGIPENIGNAGLIVKPGDTQALIKAVESFIKDKGKREFYAIKARKRALTVHDARIGARKLEEIYLRVMRK